MGASLRRLRALMWKEFRHIQRDPRTFGQVLVMPVVMLLLFAYGLNYDIRDVSLAVYDQDRSAESRALVESFTSSNYFVLADYLTSATASRAALDKGSARVLIQIPSGFSEMIKAAEPAPVQVIVDGSEPTFAVAAAANATGLLERESFKITRDNLALFAGRADAFQPINLSLRLWYNPEGRSTFFIVPGLMAFFLMIIPVMMTSLAIVGERERGTIAQLTVSPARAWELIIGKTLPYVMIAFFDGLLIGLAGIYVFEVPFRGSAVFIVLVSLIYILSTGTLGILVSTITRTQQTSMLISQLVSMLPAFMLSGFVFPISSMPRVIQWITHAVPARYYLEILRSVFLKGSGVEVLWPQVGALLIISAVLITLSTWRFKKVVS